MNLWYISGIILIFINSALFGVNIVDGDIGWAMVNLIGTTFSVLMVHMVFRKK